MSTYIIRAVAWPGDSWVVRFACERCGRLADDVSSIKGKCNRLGTRKLTQAVEQLREIVMEGEGPRPRAARSILDALGFGHTAAAQDADRQSLARGLGQQA